MEKSIYITLALAEILSTSSCNDDESFPGDPSMEIKTENADALFGDSLLSTIKTSDVDVPLSTLKAQSFYGEEQVSETVTRTKMSGGDYTGKIYIPYYANVFNEKTTLKYILQNIHFTTTEQETEPTSARPSLPYLTLVSGEGQKYQMDRQSMYRYSVSEDFSQKIKVYTKTPGVGKHGSELTFDWGDNMIAVGSTTSIPFSNTEPGSYMIQFNTFNYEAGPLAKLLSSGREMEPVENDVYVAELLLKRNDILTFEGVPIYGEWWVDPDLSKKQEDGTLKFLPIDGSYRIIANDERQYLSVIALEDGGAAKLQNNRTGTIWVIGNEIGKPSISLYEMGRTPENGLCMPRLTAKEYQLTSIAGVTMKTSDIDFKSLYINKWDNGESKGDATSTTSDLARIIESGNLELQEGQKFEGGGIYKLTVDVTKGNTEAVLTVEKVGQVDLLRPDITISGMRLEEGSPGMYQLQMFLMQNQILEIGGVGGLNDWYAGPDYLVKTGDSHLRFLPVAGSYRVTVNAICKCFAVVYMNGNSEAGLGTDGHGTIWLLGCGVSSPSIKGEFNWGSSTAYCVAEISLKIYQFAERAGAEGSMAIGERMRYDYISAKYLGGKSWDQQFHQRNLQMDWATRNLLNVDEENLVLASPLEQGATYVFTPDFTQGIDKGILSVVKK